MKITLFTFIDFAGSGRKLYEAIDKHTDHDIKFYSEVGRNEYAIPRGGINIFKVPRAELQERIDSSDIIHLKCDWPASLYERRWRVKIRHKPIVQTVSAGLFRKTSMKGKAKFKPTQYGDCALRTSFETDLLYPEYNGILTPYPIDSMENEIEWKMSVPPVFYHHPTTEKSKNTKFIVDVFNRFTDAEIQVKKDRIRVPQVISMEQRKRSTILFDQFAVGAYGNAACEAMQFGIPVACWISEESFNQAPEWYRDECPVITTDRDVDKWETLIRSVLDSDMNELSRKTKDWCDKMHSYQSVAKQWDNLYNQI